MDLGLNGKVALVTGGSYGIGLAIAGRLADEGCNVAICARGKSRIDDAVRSLSRDRSAFGIVADARKAIDARKAVAAVVTKWKRLDILVNNVGGGGERIQGPVEAVPEKRWIAVYERNALAAVRFTRLVLPHMKRGQWGRVVTITSVQGHEGGGRPWYNMSKAAQTGLMKTLALDPSLTRAGITFNSVAPGAILFEGNEWDAFRNEDAKRFERYVDEKLTSGRLGEASEVADVVAFLCSDKARFVNGVSIPVDGGQSRSY